MDKILLVDGHSILSRAFFGIQNLSNSKGVPTNGIYGFFSILLHIMEEEQPTHLAVAFDMHAPTFRHRMYEAYKGNRKPMPDELHVQVPMLQNVLKALQIPALTCEGFEGDDILGTLAAECEARGMEVSILSGDRDMLQLATEHTCICLPRTRGGSQVTDYFFEKDVKAAYGVTPKEFICMKAIMGDSSDNIPGVKGIGEKGAAALVHAYHSLDEIYAHLDEIKPRTAKLLAEHEADARLSYWLAEICTSVPLKFSPETAVYHGFDSPKAYGMFREWEIFSLLKKFTENAKNAYFAAERQKKAALKEKTAAKEDPDPSAAGFDMPQEDTGFLPLQDAEDFLTEAASEEKSVPEDGFISIGDADIAGFPFADLIDHDSSSASEEAPASGNDSGSHEQNSMKADEPAAVPDPAQASDTAETGRKERFPGKTVIGLTGGVGSGKSTVTDYLREKYHARIIQADRVSEELQQPGGAAYEPMLALFGSGITAADGTFDRRKIAEIVFQDESRLAALNAIVHPLTLEAVKKQILDASEELVVYEAALPKEAAFTDICDEVWYVYASEETRSSRLFFYRGYSFEKIESIMARQLSDAAFRTAADRVIDNDASVAEAHRSADKAMKALLRSRGRSHADA